MDVWEMGPLIHRQRKMITQYINIRILQIWIIRRWDGAFDQKKRVGYILGSRTESLPVSDIRIACLDALDLISI